MKQNFKNNDTPEMVFKRSITSMFNNTQIFNRLSSTTKNKYMYWYNCGFTSFDDIKLNMKKEFDVEDINKCTFKILNQPMSCLITVVENFHTIEIMFK